MTTFIFSSVQQKILQSYTYSNVEECIKYKKKIFDKNHDKVLVTSQTSNNLILPELGNGLLGTIINAYSHHIPLVLRPDDIWLTIINAFGCYVKQHSEEMKSLFVSHEGRKELTVKLGNFCVDLSTPEMWDTFLTRMSDLIKKNIKEDILTWMTPDFSTTTSKDRTVSNIALMGTVSEYFGMKFELGCGLSKLTLLGTLNDWKLLLEKVSNLKRFGVKDLTDWSEVLIHVLTEFVNSYQETINEDFWQRICTSKRRGSGSQQTFRGWFLVFSPFSVSGRYLLRSLESIRKDHVYAEIDDDDIVCAGIDVPVVIHDLMNDKIYQTVFYSGVLMSKYDEITNELSPEVDWLLINKKNIIVDDMLDTMKKTLENYGSSQKKHYNKLITLVKYAYYLAIQSNFPNDKLVDLAKECVKFYYHTRSIMAAESIDKKIITEFTYYLTNPEYIEEINFKKYIDKSKIEKIVDGFELN